LPERNSNEPMQIGQVEKDPMNSVAAPTVASEARDPVGVSASGESEPSSREDPGAMLPLRCGFPASCTSTLPGGSAMGGALTLFRVLGIPVRVHASWLVIYGLIA
jgi:hypothetical protein